MNAASNNDLGKKELTVYERHLMSTEVLLGELEKSLANLAGTLHPVIRGGVEPPAPSATQEKEPIPANSPLTRHLSEINPKIITLIEGVKSLQSRIEL